MKCNFNKLPWWTSCHCMYSCLCFSTSVCLFFYISLLFLCHHFTFIPACQKYLRLLPSACVACCPRSWIYCPSARLGWLWATRRTSRNSHRCRMLSKNKFLIIYRQNKAWSYFRTPMQSYTPYIQKVTEKRAFELNNDRENFPNYWFKVISQF